MKKLAMILAAAMLLCLFVGCGIAETPQPETRVPTVGREETAATEAQTVPQTIPQTEPAESTAEPTREETQPPAETVFLDTALQYGNVKAMWLSQFDLMGIYRDGESQREQADFTNRMERVLDNVKAQGFNTVYLQVRPNGDSMYPSDYYPMSAYVTGVLGRDAQYDPVEIIVRLAHVRELSIHAWINPMRAMAEEDITLVDDSYTIRQWHNNPDTRGKYMKLSGGVWYLNPAYDEVRNLIVSGAREVLERYDFDGLHMDDYFYPTTETYFDTEAYGDYLAAGGTLSLEDFRRNALSELVWDLHQVTQSSKPGRLFGVSPAGNLDTVYNKQYADVYLWCTEEGYIDYICPQVYFGLEHGKFDFVKVCRQYQDMIQTDTVDLIVGMTFGKAMTGEDPWAGTGKNEWKDHKDVLARCLQTTLDLEGCRGVSVFSYQYFFDPVTGEEIPETVQERENFVPALKEIVWQ